MSARLSTNARPSALSSPFLTAAKRLMSSENRERVEQVSSWSLTNLQGGQHTILMGHT